MYTGYIKTKMFPSLRIERLDLNRKSLNQGGMHMALGNFWYDTRLCKRTRSHTRILATFIAVAFTLLCSVSFAAEKLPKYQVIPGSDDKAYLLDTSTGYVWILTYRTLAAGREPIAIPYKFIKASPKNQNDFIVENIRDMPMPLNGHP
jgi:hypothetical protein